MGKKKAVSATDPAAAAAASAPAPSVAPVAASPGKLTVLAIAIVCHEANRALCAGLGDFSQTSWEEAPEWQKESAIVGVQFNLENPNAPASGSHDSWLAQKQNDGWKYGPVKDADKKEHPCFVPYEELPKDQQAKDHLFKGVVAALAPLVDVGSDGTESEQDETESEEETLG